MGNRYFFFILFSLLLSLSLLGAQSDERILQLNLAYHPDSHQGYEGTGFQFPSYFPLSLPSSFVPVGNDDGRSLGNGRGVLKLQAVYTQKRSYQTDYGDAEVQIDTLISPVTLALENRLVYLPLPFVKLELGAHMGTGWTLGVVGLGLNSDGTGETDRDSFSGMVLKSWFQGTLQMDTEYFWPGEWHHILLSSSHKIAYQFYSNARNNQPWQYMMDNGENFNGWIYQGKSLIAYQMPLRWNLVGILMETQQNLGYVKELSPVEQGGWGSDFLFIQIGPIASLKLNQKSSIIMLMQFKNERVYTRDTIFYNYFQNRSSTGRSYWSMDRLALMYRYTL